MGNLQHSSSSIFNLLISVFFSYQLTRSSSFNRKSTDTLNTQKKRLLNRPSFRPTGREKSHVDRSVQNTRGKTTRQNATQKSVSIQFDVIPLKMSNSRQDMQSCYYWWHSAHTFARCRFIKRKSWLTGHYLQMFDTAGSQHTNFQHLTMLAATL